MISRIRHTGIRVADIEKSMQFYHALGFTGGLEADETWMNSEIKIKIAKLQAPDGSVIELIQVLQGEWSETHFAVELEEDLPAMTKELIKTKGGMVSENHIRNVYYTTDPDGHNIELVYFKHQENKEN